MARPASGCIQTERRYQHDRVLVCPRSCEAEPLPGSREPSPPELRTPRSDQSNNLNGGPPPRAQPKDRGPMALMHVEYFSEVLRLSISMDVIVPQRAMGQV